MYAAERNISNTTCFLSRRFASFLIQFAVGFLWCRLSLKKTKAEKDPNKPKHPRAPSPFSCKSPNPCAVLRFVLIPWCASLFYGCGVFFVLQEWFRKYYKAKHPNNKLVSSKHSFISICVLLFIRIAVISGGEYCVLIRALFCGESQVRKASGEN
jgi:hypothetical protein